MARRTAIEGEITLYGLDITYDVEPGTPPRRSSGSQNLYSDDPGDPPEVTIKSATIADKMRWAETCADFDLDDSQDPADFITEYVWDDAESEILEMEGLE